MDYMTVLAYALEVVETGALIGGLVFLTKAIKEKKDTSVRKSRFIQGGIYLVIFFALNIIGQFFFQ